MVLATHLIAAQPNNSKLIISGRILAENSESDRYSFIQNIFRNRLLKNQKLLTDFTEILMRGKMPIKNPPNTQETTKYILASVNSSVVDPYFFPKNTNDILTAFRTVHLSGVTHSRWGMIIFWSGTESKISIDAIVPEDKLGATNAGINFAQIQSLPSCFLPASRSNVLPLLISVKSDTTFMILLKTSSGSDTNIKIYLPPTLVLTDLRAWQEPPFKMGDINAHEIYWDMVSGKYTYFYSTFDGVAESMEDTKIKWKKTSTSSPKELPDL